MSDTVVMDVSKLAAPARRLEAFTGSGRRRRWSADEKAEIVAESHSSGDTVCGVARRHGLTPPQLFAWRREMRQGLAISGNRTAPVFVPVVVEGPSPEAAPQSREPRARRPTGISGIIEVEIGGVTVRVGRGAQAKTVAAVIRALKAGA